MLWDSKEVPKVVEAAPNLPQGEADPEAAQQAQPLRDAAQARIIEGVL